MELVTYECIYLTFFLSGGPPLAARRLHRLDKLLYQKRAEEEFLRTQKRRFPNANIPANSESSLMWVDIPDDVSPSASCLGEADGFVVNINTGLVCNF